MKERRYPKPMSDDQPHKPRRALFGVAREEYEQLQAELEAQRAARERSEAAQAQLEARDRARTDRIEAVLGDAATVASELETATGTIARLVAADGIDQQQLIDALHAALGGRADGVDAKRAGDLPAALHDALAQRTDGVVTLARTSTGAAAEPLLDVTAALAGEVAVVVRWRQDVYDDGSLRAIAERLCRAAAASLAGRDLAANHARRWPVSLLGAKDDAARFAALREAQEQPVEEVTVKLAPGAPKTYSGLFGEPAWDGERFHLAQALDRCARELGGEAFELEGAFACLVPRAGAETMRGRARAILGDSSVEADVLEP
jgi:hypothetical protein